MTQPCCVCHKPRPVFATVEVDGQPHHYCQACWRKKRAEFIEALARGDEKAVGILTALIGAMGQGPKADD